MKVPEGYFMSVACNKEAMVEHDKKMKGVFGPHYPLFITPGLVGIEFDNMILSKESMEELAIWLGSDGIQFFKKTKEEHGRIDAVFSEGGIPHPVHLREGMQVRNFLRGLDECQEWDAHKLDDNWVDIIETIIL